MCKNKRTIINYYYDYWLLWTGQDGTRGGDAGLDIRGQVSSCSVKSGFASMGLAHEQLHMWGIMK